MGHEREDLCKALAVETSLHSACSGSSYTNDIPKWDCQQEAAHGICCKGHVSCHPEYLEPCDGLPSTSAQDLALHEERSRLEALTTMTLGLKVLGNHGSSSLEDASSEAGSQVLGTKVPASMSSF